MNVTRSYATPDKAVNVHHLLLQLVDIEVNKLVNTMTNSPASHEKNPIGGECA